jgi:hypothetical protein
MSNYRDLRHIPSADDDEPPPPPKIRRRPERKGFDLNELPIWTWVAILLVVVVVGGALWLMTRNTEGATTATPTPNAAAPAGASGTTTPGAKLQPTNTPGGPTPIIIANTPTPGLPTEVGVGMKVIVFGTGADKLRVRAGPGTTNATLLMVTDDTTFKVLEGPQAGDGKQWWRVQLDDGTVGWVVGDFLKPTR